MATRQSTELYFPKSHNASSSSSTNKSTVKKDDKTQNLVVTEEPAEILPEIDYFSRGDYLELLDFDDPAASPSSSSDNSSCVTISSDECFDSLALLKELDSEINQTQKADDHKEASTSRNGGREIVKGNRKHKNKNKNKFMCFMPFYFIF